MEEDKMISIDVSEIAPKCKTKGEVYRVLTTTGEIYLPPIDQTNCNFIRDILCGDKRFIGCHQIKIIEVPHIEGLRIPDLLAFVRKHCDIDLYLPNYDCEKYPSRAWICNIVSSLIHEKFKQFVDQKITESNAKIDLKKGNKFFVLPAIAKIFTDTKFTSKRRGRFHQLVKNSKQRRNEKEHGSKEETKEKELNKLIHNQEEEIDRKKDELRKCKDRLEDQFRDSEMLKRLYEQGYIDLDGKPTSRNYNMRE